MEDLYSILEVSPQASIQQFKESYKRLALVTHPDKNSSATATSESQRLNDAYNVLTDATTRATYDRDRDDENKKHKIAAKAREYTKKKEAAAEERRKSPYGGEGGLYGKARELFNSSLFSGGRRGGGGYTKLAETTGKWSANSTQDFSHQQAESRSRFNRIKKEYADRLSEWNKKMETYQARNDVFREEIEKAEEKIQILTARLDNILVNLEGYRRGRPEDLLDRGVPTEYGIEYQRVSAEKVNCEHVARSLGEVLERERDLHTQAMEYYDLEENKIRIQTAMDVTREIERMLGGVEDAFGHRKELQLCLLNWELIGRVSPESRGRSSDDEFVVAGYIRWLQNSPESLILDFDRLVDTALQIYGL